MIKKLVSTDQNIINWIKTVYGIEVIKLEFLPLGADMNASIYKAITHDKSYFVKLKWGHHHNNSLEIVELLHLLHKAGIQVIPALKTINGHFTQRIEDFTLTIYPFVEGQDGFNRHLTNEQWQKLGKSLRQLHKIVFPPEIRKQIRHETYSSKWREIVRSYLLQTENEKVQHENQTNQNEIALKLSNFIKEKILIINRLLARAEDLSQKVHELSPEFVLCHSDIHGGNVLLDENDTLFIVDWDDPLMAPKERDLMFIGGGVGNVWNDPYEEQLFYKGYGETKINKTILTYYRHERIVEDIALYIQGLLLTNEGGDDRQVMYKQFIDIFEPNGVIEIAFKTDEIS